MKGVKKFIFNILPLSQNNIYNSAENFYSKGGIAMKTPHLLFILIVILSLNIKILGDQLPKFGKVSKEELQMTSIPEDPEADAVRLFEKGDLEIFLDNNRYKLRLKQHVRIKILTEKGKHYADFKIPYWHEDRIHSLKAHTILPNGKKIKLNKKDIFEEEIKKTKYKVFAIPGVEVGAVIEYEFEKISEYLYFLKPWYFQNREFTRISQYSVMPLPGFSYNVFFRNTFEIEPEVEDIIRPGIRTKLRKFNWKMVDIPPIREEPYMRTLEDYRAALHFQLVYFKNQYQYIEFIDSWPKLVKERRDKYKESLRRDDFLENLVEGMNLSALPEEERIKVIYEYVRDNVETTSSDKLYPEKKPALVVKESKGSGAEKNLLLVNLLNIAGFDAHPLLISTRDHGRVWQNTPRLTQFNYVLAYTRSGINTYIMDTRDKYCPFKTLPSKDLVETGLLIDEGKGKFVKIPRPKTTNMIYCKTSLELTPEGDVIATTEARFEGYRSINARKRIVDDGKEEFVNEMLKDCYGEVEIDSFKFEQFENPEMPLLLSVSYRAPQYAQVVGDMIYLNAPILNGFEENPFKREKRYFLVEFPYNLAQTENIDITFPEGFQVMEIPKGIINRQHKNKLTFMNNWKAEQNTINIQRQFMRRELTFSPREYSGLRNFYDRVVKADQGQIVLGRAEAELEINE
jgi:hypothetical protein